MRTVGQEPRAGIGTTHDVRSDREGFLGAFETFEEGQRKVSDPERFLTRCPRGDALDLVEYFLSDAILRASGCPDQQDFRSATDREENSNLCIPYVSYSLMFVSCQLETCCNMFATLVENSLNLTEYNYIPTLAA